MGKHTNTIIAPRRTPFPIGTKMVFAQATPPADWTLDVADNDRFLRVVNTVGAGIGGPDNLGTVSNPSISHTHGFSHAHSMASHVHNMSHTHVIDNGSTDDMSTTMATDFSSYMVRDDVSPFWAIGTHGISVEEGLPAPKEVPEGSHNHNVDNTAGPNFTTSGSSSTSSTSIVDPGMGAIDIVHGHNVDGNFKPKYVDIIIATLTK